MANKNRAINAKDVINALDNYNISNDTKEFIRLLIYNTPSICKQTNNREYNDMVNKLIANARKTDYFNITSYMYNDFESYIEERLEM